MGNSEETKLSGLYPLTPGFVKPKKHRIPLLASRYSIIGIGCLSFSYYLTVLSIPEKRLVMDYIHDEYSNNGSGKPRYNGGMIDTFKKIYLEEGFLGMMGKKDALSFLIEAGTGLVYSQTIGKIFQLFNSNDNLMVSLGSSFIDNLLLGVFIHPIIVISHANHKRFDDEKKEKGIFEIGKKIYEENGIRGLYRGFGLFTLQNESPFTTVPKSGLQWAIRSGIEFILGTKHESLDSDTIDSLDMLEGAICDMILDAVSYPFLLSYGRYIGDQGSTYVSYVDCFQKMYQQEGWKGLYKGSWIGFLLK